MNKLLARPLILFVCLLAPQYGIKAQTAAQKPVVLYQNKIFTVFDNGVVEGKNKAQIVSPSYIKSNYRSRGSDTNNLDKEWKLSLNVSKKPQYKSDQPIVDALFNLSLEEALKNIEADSTLRTGSQWPGVWTRDISYSIYLAFAYHEPVVARISLMKKVKRKRIIQDTGTGGSYPCSSDRIIWAIAAWEIYKVTGDKSWLKICYEIVKNTLADDAKNLLSSTGMYKGETSFLDWRSNGNYPKWAEPKDIFVSEALGTNAIFYRAHLILAEMAKELGKPHQIYLDRAAGIKKAVNQYLWQPENGFYAQYLYGRGALSKLPRFEALGEALSVLFGVAGAEQAKSIFEKSPLTPYGTSCFYPQIPDIQAYHSDAIWPFVQSYWNLAAAKTGNEKALLHGLGAIYRAGALFLTNYENIVAQTGDYWGTVINSDRMLWSMSGNLAMVHRLFIGMQFETGGIGFAPIIPKVYGGTKTLKNFSYRKANLDIKVVGFGNKVVSFKLDGKKLAKPFFAAGLKGKHSIEIVMNNQRFDSSPITMVANKATLITPIVSRSAEEPTKLVWQQIVGATKYLIYENGKIIGQTTQLFYQTTAFKTYQISAIDAQNIESFLSEPVLFDDQKNSQKIQIESFAAASVLAYTGFDGKGFVEISNQANKQINMNIFVLKAGRYQIQFRYSNGSGEDSQQNKCGLRSLYLGDKYLGAMVFPQRGIEKWSDWGLSNAYILNLKPGKHTIKLVFEPWNINMNVDINTAMIDYLEVLKVD